MSEICPSNVNMEEKIKRDIKLSVMRMGFISVTNIVYVLVVIDGVFVCFLFAFFFVSCQQRSANQAKTEKLEKELKSFHAVRNSLLAERR